MPLSGKVAQLRVAGRHEGSAWLIDAQHALTALHCVEAEDGTPYAALSLHFHGEAEPVPVRVLARAAGLDVALLQWSGSDPALLARLLLRVVPLARRPCQRGDDCLMRGHPGQSVASHPDGILVRGTVLATRHPLRHAGSELPVIQFADNSIRAGYQGTTNLQGLSGGPVMWDAAGQYDAAIGLVIAEGVAGNYLHAVALADIAQQIPQVQQALAAAQQPNPNQRHICLMPGGDASRWYWQAARGPDSVGELWGAAAFADRIECTVPLRRMGRLGKALVRLAAWANLAQIAVPDQAAWREQLQLLEKAHRQPEPEPPLTALDASEPLVPGGLLQDGDQLATTIQSSLNLKLLDLLDERLYRLLNGQGASQLGCEIEADLRQKMWQVWQSWRTRFEQHQVLLQRYLIRVFSVDGGLEYSDDALLCIGPCPQAQEQLLHSTVFALALAAASIDAVPEHGALGNLRIGQHSAHACGVKIKDGKRLSRFAATQEWKADILILPFLEGALLHEFEKNVSMTRTSGTLGHDWPRFPPVAITGENAFLEALEHGAAAVHQYYQTRYDEIHQRKAAIRVPSRMESLHV